MTFEQFKTNVEARQELRRQLYDYAMMLLAEVASMHGLSFDECCEAALNEIKDRKGKMVAGGAFVKDGDV